MHYYAYFRNFESEKASEAWFKYDDSRVINIGDWELVLANCMQNREQPILLLFEELRNKEAVYEAENNHYLNELIGEAQWKEMFEKSKAIDKDLEQLNAPFSGQQSAFVDTFFQDFEK